MSDSRGGGGMVALGLAHVVCCGGLLLAASGGLGWVVAWLVDGGLAWIAAAIVLLGAGLILRGRESHKAKTSDAARGAPQSVARDLTRTGTVEPPRPVARSRVRPGGHQDSPRKGAA